MDLELTNKVVLISGSSRSLGLQTAKQFAAEGARVVITGRDAGTLAAGERELTERYGSDSVRSVLGDITTTVSAEAAVAQTLEAWGRLDILIANVGGTARPGWDVTDADWAEVFQQNLFGSLRLARAAIPAMIDREEGSICFVSSIAGLEELGAPITYASAKAALTAGVKSLARQLGNKNIRVNGVAPGNLLFPGSAWEAKLADRHDEIMETIHKEVPLRRFGTAEEIADVLLFLASPRASFVTGACWVVDGGQTRAFD